MADKKNDTKLSVEDKDREIFLETLMRDEDGSIVVERTGELTVPYHAKPSRIFPNTPRLSITNMRDELYLARMAEEQGYEPGDVIRYEIKVLPKERV
ncbi:MAG: hypothetical protein U9R08_04795 [Nanoarchaeota archaeon]|nr:hypothetical protein [Nanoarchaeota archaeon]